VAFTSLRLGLASAGACGLLAGTALAAGSGPPPPPKSTNHKAVQIVAQGGTLGTPTSFAFGAGQVFEGDGGSNQSGPPNGGVNLLKGGKATRLAGSPAFVAGLAWHKGVLYVSGGTPTGPKSATWQILAWSGWNGKKFTKRKAIYTAPKKFQGFNGIAFGPDGRLYVGVDVGLLNHNDHGPANLSPYLYDILSLKPNGKGLKVFASGIRQPWQIAFAGHSRSPFVSALGQDGPPSAATKAPDFVLKVRQGQNYGFPQCNWIKPKACAGFAKPFKMFAPHTDVMGLAIIGKRLYMSEFVGGGHGTGAVVSMPLSGKGTPKTLLHGFSAPVVGLGAHDGWIYVGSLTKQVFRVRP
jgi:glucose/arabinose dehydrogenase